ncbi:hypothetical protein BMW23_1117 [Bodo saltans virus]|uniref:RING-CH-type domain-containing protein n=1 Tax=Bodo saltans virus TaxID=2024608 RepID=A0A2H4UW63_9VIRU|nr:hypothetical protein QJ851_gp1097 [Bodo saltans virus]ATZ81160.1 hypothetical protein BMW23_1117 [Bodo saltans virus]
MSLINCHIYGDKCQFPQSKVINPCNCMLHEECLKKYRSEYGYPTQCPSCNECYTFKKNKDINMNSVNLHYKKRMILYISMIVAIYLSIIVIISLSVWIMDRRKNIPVAMKYCLTAMNYIFGQTIYMMKMII